MSAELETPQDVARALLEALATALDRGPALDRLGCNVDEMVPCEIVVEILDRVLGTLRSMAEDPDGMPHPDELARLHRMARAIRPPVDERTSGEAVVRAHALVTQYLESAPWDDLPPGMNADAMRASGLVAGLEDVHEGFASLHDPNLQPKLIELLASGRAATGIVAELNRMAHFPLGKRLTQNSVGRAERAARDD